MRGRRGCDLCAPGSLRESSSVAKTPVLPAIPPLGRPVSFEADVKPVLENRCVVCHACCDGPCQLLFSSPAGVERGANKLDVYDTARRSTRRRSSAHRRASRRCAGRGWRRCRKCRGSASAAARVGSFVEALRATP